MFVLHVLNHTCLLLLSLALQVLIVVLRVLVSTFTIAGAWSTKCGTRGVEVTPPLSTSCGTSLLGLHLIPVAHALELHYHRVYLWGSPRCLRKVKLPSVQTASSSTSGALSFDLGGSPRCLRKITLPRGHKAKNRPAHLLAAMKAMKIINIQGTAEEVDLGELRT